MSASMMRMTRMSRTATRQPLGMKPAPLRVVVVRAQKDTQEKASNVAQDLADKIGESGFAQKVVGYNNQITVRAVTDANVKGGEGEYISKSAIPAFTREREINVGRIAMLGFLSAVAGELVTHQGIIGQVNTWTGIPTSVVGAVFVAIIGWCSLAVLPGLSDTYSEENQRDVAKRPAGPVQGATDFSQDPKAAAGGIAPWAGFTRENELFNGRMAQLGFLAALTGEWASGLGPLGQVAHYLGTEPTDAYYGTAQTVLLFFFISFLGGAAISGNWGQKKPGDERIY